MTKNRTQNFPLVDRWSLLWLALAFVLTLFTYGMYRNPLAGWLVSIFYIRYLRTKRVGTGYLFVLLALVVANSISWWNTSFTLPPVARIIFGLVVGLMYSIPFLLDRLLVPRFSGFAATLVFPFANAALEFLGLWPNPMGVWGSLANTQFSSTYLTQLMSITGLWGVTFLISWFAAIVNWIWEENAAWMRIRRGVMLYAGVMLIVMVYGMVRLSLFQPTAGTVRVHGIVENEYTREEWWDEIAPLNGTDREAFRAITLPIFERYLQSTRREAQAGAQIVVWPELAVEGYREDVAALLAEARQIAGQENIYLVMGLGVVSPDIAKEYLEENRLVVVDPQGDIVIDQDKYGCTAANMYDFEIQTVDTPYGRLAGVLCCDLEFPYVVRQISRKDVDILFVPSFEPTAANLRAHSQMSHFRAIENGVSIFRVTIQGLSLAVDPYGRVVNMMNDTLAGERTFVAQLPNQRIFTPYSTIGDAFGWFLVTGFLVILGWGMLGRRKTETEQPAKPATIH